MIMLVSKAEQYLQNKKATIVLSKKSKNPI
jgi:hypothetical protein